MSLSSHDYLVQTAPFERVWGFIHYLCLSQLWRWCNKQVLLSLQASICLTDHLSERRYLGYIWIRILTLSRRSIYRFDFSELQFQLRMKKCRVLRLIFRQRLLRIAFWALGRGDILGMYSKDCFMDEWMIIDWRGLLVLGDGSQLRRLSLFWHICWHIMMLSRWVRGRRVGGWEWQRFRRRVLVLKWDDGRVFRGRSFKYWAFGLLVPSWQVCCWRIWWGNLLFRFWNIRDGRIRVGDKDVYWVSSTTYWPGATRNDLIRGLPWRILKYTNWHANG